MQARALAGARIRKARWNPGGRAFELLLRAGGGDDPEVDILLRYRGVTRLEPPMAALAALIEDSTLVITGAQLSGQPGEWFQRVAFGDAGEIALRCGAVERSETPAPGPAYGDAGYRFEILSC